MLTRTQPDEKRPSLGFQGGFQGVSGVFRGFFRGFRLGSWCSETYKIIDNDIVAVGGAAFAFAA